MSNVFIGSPNKRRINFVINQTDLLAHTTQNFIVPINGVVDEVGVVGQGAVTTGGNVTVQAVPAVYNTEGGLDTTSFANAISGDTLVAGTGAKGAVAGAVVAVPNAFAVGAVLISKATVGDPSALVVKGQQIEIDLSGFATAGALNGYIQFRDEVLANGPSG